MKEKTLGLVLLLAAAWLLWTAIQDQPLKSIKQSKTTPTKITFGRLVSKDLENLKKSGHLPPIWEQIQSASYQFNSNEQQNIIKYERLDITESPSGKYRLEIEFIDVPDEEKPALILQFSLFDLKTNNKVWELGRTYPILPFQPQAPSTKDADPPAERSADQTPENHPAQKTDPTK